MVTYVTLLERKFAARMQSRIGPYYVGWPHGWLQPIADALKLMMKEDIVPSAAGRWVYNLAPIAFLVPCMLIFATIPFAPDLGLADLNIGVLFFLAVSSLEVVGLFMGGWGSHNKYALLSAMRAVNQIISYDLPFVFAALIPVVLAGSLQLSVIAGAQRELWFVAYPVIGQLGFLAFLVATIAAENRVPFDILEAESELVAGFRVEYSGMKFALIQLGEYAHMLASSFLGALLFLGAWLGPGPAWLGPVWFLLKAMLVFLVVTLAVRRYLKQERLVPSGFMNGLEAVVEFIRDSIVAPNVGRRWVNTWTPLVLTLFIFILCANAIGLIPIFDVLGVLDHWVLRTGEHSFVKSLIHGGTTATANFNVTAALATITFGAIIVAGSKAHGFFNHWKNLAPKGLAWPIYILLIPIEVLGMFVRPFALTMRLAANMTGGHIAILAILSFVFLFKELSGRAAVGIGVGMALSVPLAVGISMLEIIVVLVQAYVFTLLTAVFIGMAIHVHH